MIPVGWTNDQYFEALPIDDLPEGKEKNLAIRAFEGKYSIKWPKSFPRRNQLVEEVLASGASWKDVVMNGRFSSAKPPY